MKLKMHFPKEYAARLIIILVPVLLAFAGLWFIIHEVIVEKEQDIDNAILNALPAYNTSGRTRFMEVITFLGSRNFLIFAYLVVIAWFLFHRAQKNIAINAAVTGTAGILLVSILKNIFKRDRPPNPLMKELTNYSFPSGHTTSGFIFYGLLIYLVWKSRLRSLYKNILITFLFLVSLFIGISRIYLRMHYPSDVLAGFCLGFMWLVVALYFLQKLENTTPGKVPGKLRPV